MKPTVRSQQAGTDLPAEEESVRSEDLVAALDMVITALQQRDSLTGEERVHLHTLLRLYEAQRRRQTHEPLQKAIVCVERESQRAESVPDSETRPLSLHGGESA